MKMFGFLLWIWVLSHLVLIGGFAVLARVLRFLTFYTNTEHRNLCLSD
uniref:Uncharacterized protein n=1 Tax=Arundo donax TaxID=35708 RepID=A0A0A8YSV7_ARUDO